MWPTLETVHHSSAKASTKLPLLAHPYSQRIILRVNACVTLSFGGANVWCVYGCQHGCMAEGWLVTTATDSLGTKNDYKPARILVRSCPAYDYSGAHPQHECPHIFKSSGRERCQHRQRFTGFTTTNVADLPMVAPCPKPSFMTCPVRAIVPAGP